MTVNGKFKGLNSFERRGVCAVVGQAFDVDLYGAIVGTNENNLLNIEPVLIDDEMTVYIVHAVGLSLGLDIVLQLERTGTDEKVLYWVSSADLEHSLNPFESLNLIK